jgi:hypothetical protein|tara:strand:- start:97 stop:303 length:207 start_codon:yes stop_codon:yes gene_type:complete
MSKMKDYMMDIEEFCDGYYYRGLGLKDFTIDEVVEDAGMHFKTDIAKTYARQYIMENQIVFHLDQGNE